MVIPLLLALSVATAPSVPALDTTHPPPALFTFRIGFWNNLHHFLYVLGRARNKAPDAQREAVANAPNDIEGLAARSDPERAAWEEAVAFYAAGPSKQDAVFDASLVRQTRLLAAAPDSSELSDPALDPQLVAALKKAAPIYRIVWWTRHRRADVARRDEYQALVDKYGEQTVKRLTAVYRTTWPSQPRVIDIAAYANWAGAYSTDEGLIVMASTDPSIAGPYGLETLLHESSHQWDDEIQGRLREIAAKTGKALPGQLSHMLIFFTSGEIVGEVFPGYVPYAVKAGVWNRGWSAFKPVLEEYWRPYVRGTGTFEEAVAAVLAHLP